MPHLLVVLQTHTLGDSQHNLKLHEMPRYCGATKPEVTRRCVKSLVESLNYAKQTLDGLDIELKVFDDHSDDESVAQLRRNLDAAQFPTNVEFLETRGIMPSILKCYDYGRVHGKEWVYFVQDDYLYEKNAIHDMILAIHEFSRKLGAPASIYPFNDPYKYEPVNVVVQSRIVRSQGRHWRTQIMTASCFMTHLSVVREHWDLFEAMGKHEVSGDMEDKTINQLFRTRNMNLFVPIPSLALHMQYSTEEDPLINWREWWDKHAPAEPKQIDKSVKSLLNVGSGKSTIESAIFAEDLVGFKEYRLDIDKNNNPDIVADVTDLSAIDDESFDVVYSSHMIEHLDFYQVVNTIKSFLRITKTGGTVRFVVPNLKAIALEVARGNLLNPVYQSPSGPISPIDILFGYRASVVRGAEFMRHKTGFTKESLHQMLAEANIQGFKVEERGFDLLVNLQKSKTLNAASEVQENWSFA